MNSLPLSAPDAALVSLGARLHELEAIRRAMAVTVTVTVTREGYVHAPHVGETFIIPHGWLPDFDAAHVEAPRTFTPPRAPEPFDPRDFPDAPVVELPEVVCVLDTETTGLQADARVIEVAVARLDLRQRRLTRAWPSKDAPGQLLDAGVPIPSAASAVSGITDDDLRGAPTFADIAKSLTAFVGDLPVIAHGAAFDERLVGREFDLAGIARPPWRWFCSRDLARAVVPGLASYSLSGRNGAPGLRHILGLGEARAHRAWGDVLTTCALLRCLRDRAGAPWQSWSGSPMRVWGAATRAPGVVKARASTPRAVTPKLRGIA